MERIFPLSRVLFAIVLYPVVAVLSFWRFGDHGVTVQAVLIAAALNLAFGFAFRWLAVVLAVLVFPVWYLSTDAACENCRVIIDAGAFSLAFAVLGAAAGQLSMSTRRKSADPALIGSAGTLRPQAFDREEKP